MPLTYCVVCRRPLVIAWENLCPLCFYRDEETLDQLIRQLLAVLELHRDSSRSALVREAWERFCRGLDTQEVTHPTPGDAPLVQLETVLGYTRNYRKAMKAYTQSVPEAAALEEVEFFLRLAHDMRQHHSLEYTRLPER